MITTIVTALTIAAFFCLIVALLLTRAERKQDWKHPFRPAEPDYGNAYDNEIVTAPTTTVTSVVTDQIGRRLDALEQDSKLTNRRLRNHAQRLTECEDMVALLNELEQEAGAEPELEHTQPLPRIDLPQQVADLFSGIDLHPAWSFERVNPVYAPTLYADVVREIAKWRVEAEDGRLDLMV